MTDREKFEELFSKFKIYEQYTPFTWDEGQDGYCVDYSLDTLGGGSDSMDICFVVKYDNNDMILEGAVETD